MARKRTTTPTRPDDARVHRSTEALQNAFLLLIEDRPLADISIREITDTAGVSYSTFFRRFSSKEELLEDIAASEVRRLLSLATATMSDRKSLESGEPLSTYVQDHRTLWATLLTGGAASAMREEFMHVIEEISHKGPRANPWLPIELAVPFTASCIFEILTWWMRQPEDYPLNNVIKLIDALVIDTLVRPREISLE